MNTSYRQLLSLGASFVVPQLVSVFLVLPLTDSKPTAPRTPLQLYCVFGDLVLCLCVYRVPALKPIVLSHADW